LNRVKLANSKRGNALNMIRPYTSNHIACDLDFLTEALFIHAKIYIHERNIDEAETLYSKALSIAEWIKKDHSIDQALRGLAKVNALKGNYAEALVYLDKSLVKAEKTHEPILRARNLLTRAWIYKQKQEHLEAKKYKKQALEIYMEHRGRIAGLIDANFYMFAGR
jgi:tetratricopeptide (TPR) repeat protein